MKPSSETRLQKLETFHRGRDKRFFAIEVPRQNVTLTSMTSSNPARPEHRIRSSIPASPAQSGDIPIAGPFPI